MSELHDEARLTPFTAPHKAGKPPYWLRPATKAEHDAHLKLLKLQKNAVDPSVVVGPMDPD